MNNYDLLIKIEEIFKPLQDGQIRLETGFKQLEAGQKKLEEGQKQLQLSVTKQGKDIQALKQSDERIEMKIELVNSNLKKTEEEIISNITYLLHNAATQKQVDDLEDRIGILEKKTGAHN